MVERIYGLLLRLLPSSERSVWGPEMLETYRRRAAAASALGVWGRLRFHARELAGLLVAVVRARSAAGRGSGAVGLSSAGRPPLGEKLVVGAQRLRHAWRRLRRSGAFSLAAALTLALGIGATVSIYAVVDSLMLDPLPYPEADRLVFLDHAAPGLDADRGLGFTPGFVHHYRERNRTLAELAAYDTDDATLTGGGDAERIRVTAATPPLLSVLGSAPALGRWFGDEDATRGDVVVLSHGLWARRYGADPAVVGRTIRLDQGAYEIVGVMPPSFRFPEAGTAAWVPLRIDGTTAFGGFWLRAVGRLRPGVTSPEVEADLTRLIGTVDAAYPERTAFFAELRGAVGIAPLATPLKSAVLGGVERMLWTLLGTVALVLLIAGANVANLFLVRAESRTREAAVRGALGAGRRQLVLDDLAESGLLALAGGAAGLVLAWAAVRLLVRLGPADLPRLHEVGLDGSVLAVAAAVTALAGLLFGLIPAWRGRPGLAAALSAGGRRSTASGRAVRGRSLLVVAQMALALVLLIGSGLMVRSFLALRAIDPGFDATSEILTLELALPADAYPGRDRAAAFHDQLVTRLESLPGVRRAGVVSCLPVQGWCTGDPLQVRGRPHEPERVPPVVALRRAGPGYFEAMGIDVEAGRAFERADHEQGRPVVVVSRSAASQYFADADPLGQQIRPPAVGDPNEWHTVVGVVEDVPARDLMRGGDPLVYFPLAGDGFAGVSTHAMAVAVHGAGPGLPAAVRARIQALDPNIPITRVRTSADIVRDAGARLAFATVLLVIGAAVALALGAVGIYGVIAYLVGQRRAEFGVRLALGARAADVRRMVLRQGGMLAVAGLAVGTVAALGLTRFMRAMLFGVAPTDAATFVAVGGLLLAVALLACWVPARRAAALDPVEALRAD